MLSTIKLIKTTITNSFIISFFNRLSESYCRQTRKVNYLILVQVSSDHIFYNKKKPQNGARCFCFILHSTLHIVEAHIQPLFVSTLNKKASCINNGSQFRDDDQQSNVCLLIRQKMFQQGPVNWSKCK